MPSTRAFRVLLRLHMYLSCCKAVGQADRICCTVGWWWLQRGHLESILILHLLRLSGVGRVSDPSLSRKESCPAGRPAWMRPHTLFLASSSVMARNLRCTANSSSKRSGSVLCLLSIMNKCYLNTSHSIIGLRKWKESDFKLSKSEEPGAPLSWWQIYTNMKLYKTLFLKTKRYSPHSIRYSYSLVINAQNACMDLHRCMVVCEIRELLQQLQTVIMISIRIHKWNTHAVLQ